MSTEEPQQDAPSIEADATMQDTAPAPAPMGKKRPRLDLSVLGVGERKRGKSMFGVLVNTLNKAKAEDKERNASEAAKKRQLIEQRLQNKLKKDADIVRQAEEAKKDKVSAIRKEEDLQLKDSIYKLRRTRFPQLSNYLLTSDIIPSLDADPDSTDSFQLSSLLPPRSHPPPLYYLPAILTPTQEAFLSKRKAQVKEVAEKEWEDFKVERAAGIEEVMTLRQNVATIRNSQAKTGDRDEQVNGDDMPVSENGERTTSAAPGPISTEDRAQNGENVRDAESMEVDDGAREDHEREREQEREKKDERPAAVDEDDAVEY
ncbi:hypothetical protein M0805_008217 [Coniferiporia weirii]|nr:hypothetical protein M0805_008217 [Coniferiporia weirii]